MSTTPPAFPSSGSSLKASSEVEPHHRQAPTIAPATRSNVALCYVIMPFSRTSQKHSEKYWTDHYERFLKPLIEENRKLNAQRSQALRGDVLRQIIADILTAHIVVADLTDHNPNVLWELGVRQSFRHGTITIAEKGTKLPFDVITKGTLFYSRTRRARFHQEIHDALEDCLKSPDRPDSSVLESVSGRGSLFEVFSRDESIRRLDGAIYEVIYNLALVAKCGQCFSSMRSSTQDHVSPANRPLYGALDLLLTSRYLSMPDDFYESALMLRGRLGALHTLLDVWHRDEDAVKKWYSDKKQAALENALNKFQHQIETKRTDMRMRT